MSEIPAADANTDANTDDAREELRRIARHARMALSAERELGVVTLSGLPAAEPLAPPPRRPREIAAAVASPTVTPGPATRATPAKPEPREPPGPPVPFVTRVREMELPADVLAPFGDLPSRVAGCTACKLHSTRTCTVFGEGLPRTDLVFCGEAPGADEDRSGRPFVGASGELLTAMIEKGMKRRREDVFVLNTLKCRPPQNRSPAPEEIAACRPFLEEQLRVIRPKVIVALGNHAIRALLGESPGISRMRGRVIEVFGAKLVPTYHPAYLLRNPAAKRDAWEDLKRVMALLADG